MECQSDADCSTDKQCTSNNECVDPCSVDNPCANNAICYGSNHRATCRCPDGLEGNPLQRCVHVECHSNFDCADHQACVANQCINPCATNYNPPCAQNAECFVRNHEAKCKCPESRPDGNPLSYCERAAQPLCRVDADCPYKTACVRDNCVDPCAVLDPCSRTAQCSVLDSVPVRTMICECPDQWVPDQQGECRRIIVQPTAVQPACQQDSDCPDAASCINRQCRNPCDCGVHSMCQVQNHRATCSCEPGYEGNPNTGCRAIGCRIDSECASDKACVNQQCTNVCLVADPCGANAECYVADHQPQCRCISGYRGNPFERCNIVGCRSNADCPSDKSCENAQCVDPCVYGANGAGSAVCSPRAECVAQMHMAICRCPAGLIGNPYVDCKPDVVPDCQVDLDCPDRLACIQQKCLDPCRALEPCHRPARCEVVPSKPVRTMNCVCPEGFVSSGSGTCKPVGRIPGCILDADCGANEACISNICKNPCNCGRHAECRIKDHKPVCSCEQGYDGNPEIDCDIKIECHSDSECTGTHSCINRKCEPVCAGPDGRQCGERAECYGINHRAVCECAPGLSGNPLVGCVLLGCRTNSDCPSSKACINTQCENPCNKTDDCHPTEVCKVYNHQPECACPAGTRGDLTRGCVQLDEICHTDGDCPSRMACIGSTCRDACDTIKPCGVNAECKVLDHVPVRTMVCECLPGYEGNAAVQCDKREYIYKLFSSLLF